MKQNKKTNYQPKLLLCSNKNKVHELEKNICIIFKIEKNNYGGYQATNMQ